MLSLGLNTIGRNASSSPVFGGTVTANAFVATATGSNGIAFTNAGARLSLSSGHANAYWYYDSANSWISTPSDVSFGTNLYVTVMRGGTGPANSVNLHASAGINLSAASSGQVTASVGALAATTGTVELSLNTNATAVGNVGTGEDDLISFSLPAGALQATGRGVKITAWGTSANNANAKTIRMKFGATNIISLALTASQANTWRAEGIVIRTGATTQEANAQIIQAGTVSQVDVEITAPAETLSGAVTIKCTGEATSDNDIVQEGMLVEFI